MERKISVSLMCADLLNLESEIKQLEKSGVDYLHMDITDGHLVPNLTFGPDFVTAMHRVSNTPTDTHLMVKDPELILSKLNIRKGDILSAHVELDRDFASMSKTVRAAGGKFGLAINPETPIEALEPWLGIIDVVILMLVRPGFAGGKLIDGILDKVPQTRAYLDARGHADVLISVDGSVSTERARLMAGMGANLFVGGTTAVYRPGQPLDQSMREFRAAIS
ncbi:ribulose-phosphate 3-epimerase [Ereboglobus sp. PH5-5]|uniref:ribulose-phosphate 3-epimerase n=1 Tax=Ereboglobus sp. PH5-5 TaxID=2940529 RepID=UPI0024061BE6|nr:ribulose-phosphate 3-epimerase [Ereboglobus sp. PH5-5]